METGSGFGMGRALLVAGVAVMLVGGTVMLRGDEPEVAPEPQAAPIPVQVRQVRSLARPEVVALSGDVLPRQTVRVGFRVAGMVSTIHVDEGQRVSAGEVLAELDAEDYRLQLEAAKAAVARITDQYERASRLRTDNQISPADYTAAETGVAEGRAKLALAQRQYDQTKLIAPVDGIIAYRGVQPGEQVPIGMPVFAIVSVNPVDVRVGVPERDIGRVRAGSTATIRIPSLVGWSGEGRVRLIGVVPDSISRTYPVRVSVPNPDGALRPGMIADVRIQGDGQVTAVTLPGEAIVRGGDGRTLVYVYSASEKRVRARAVTVGSVYDREVEIREGLAAGDMVVVGGQHRVRDGSVVQATEVPAAAGSRQ